MSNHGFPKLCGGVFFTLVLQALKQKSTAEEHYQGVKDGLDDQTVLIGLIKIINKDYIELPSNSFKTITSGYRNCKKAKSEHLPFGEPATVNAFDKLVKTNYKTALSRMTAFVNDFLEVGKDSQKDVWLVKALLELIIKDAGDEGIDDNQYFYCLENGQKIKKADLVGSTDFCLSSFLLGVWHFIVVKRRDNSPGKSDLDIESIGNSITYKLNLDIPRISEADEGDDRSEESIVELNGHTDDGVSLSLENEHDEKPSNKNIDADPKRITVNNYGTVQNQKFVSIETMNGDIHL